MFLSVYPQGPPKRYGRATPWVVALMACGGCALLVVLAIGVTGFVGFKLFGGAAQGYMDQPRKAEIFLTHLREKRYADAAQLLSPEGQKRLPEAKLKQTAEAVEKRLGALESWKMAPEPETQTQNNQITMKYRYRLRYQKGEANGLFAFHSVDPLKPSSQIEDFKIIESNPQRPDGAPGDRPSKDTLP